MRVETFKRLFISVGSVLSSMLGILYIPVLLLVTCNVIDYISRLIAEKYSGGTISSHKSFKGIAKKISMWLLVVVGVILDQLIKYATNTIGIALPFEFLVACIVAIWLICNELISIIENIKDTGVKIPSFLLPLVENIKSQTESKIEHEKEGE